MSASPEDYLKRVFGDDDLPRLPQPTSLPYQRHSETSQAAAKAALPRAGSQRARVLLAIADHGPIIDEDIGKLLGLAGNSVRPRRVELVQARLIEEDERRGTTEAGNAAERWRLTEKGRDLVPSLGDAGYVR